MWDKIAIVPHSFTKAVCAFMPVPPPNEITQLLIRIRAGDTEATELLIPIVYDELRRIARRCLRSEQDNPLQPTELVHETYLRLFKSEVGDETTEWKNRTHFFAIAALQMRRILVDHARARQADKHGGAYQRVEITEADGHSHPLDIDIILPLDEALRRLERLHPRHAKIVELRYFGGLTQEEAAEALDISLTTLKREWEFARAWLFRQLTS